MKTPICDFVGNYVNSETLRAHMPGHKGAGLLGFEQFDITEICGADSLYEADGIIARSEANASQLFGCPTFYSTEGSSQCIRAMLYLALLHAKGQGRPAKIAAARNVHKTFLSGAALLDLEVVWLYPENQESYLACKVDFRKLEDALGRESCTAVYLTSPDYLGNTADAAAVAEVCRRYGALLLVDNAHGAYLRFLPESRHPMDLGTDLCCDSAHKTLPVLTGGAYLHVRDRRLAEQAKTALALFGSTSPSYLILQSLDATNRYLAEGYRERLGVFCAKVGGLKEKLKEAGYVLCGDEPLKVTISTKPRGYTGVELARLLRELGIECEFADPDYLVLMLTPETGDAGLKQIGKALLSIPQKAEILQKSPAIGRGVRILSIREAMLSPMEVIPIGESCGRILAAATVGCPPAVPILVCGERIDKWAVEAFRYYGLETCTVVI